ncbi:hypothetical protein BC941DRAFT_449491 [Chlamydoabsidia padenii]|nr:hypothetical protein BC941DRAFT_449491 [Chlamydoabsidia padenii]
MHLLLEQSRQEKQRLSDEMNGKEAVWERLVTAKESYALKIQDMQAEISRLQHSLQQSQQQAIQLESQLVHHSPDTMEQQYSRRIEKLERLVREWQQDAQESHQQVQQQQRTHGAQMDQLRRDLAERDQVTAAMERDYEAAKQANTDTVRHYESVLAQWTRDRDMTLKAKDDQIERLGNVIEELKACHFLLPPSPNTDDDDDDDDSVGSHSMVEDIIPDLVRKIKTTTTTLSNNNKDSRMYSSRRRLEQQLELTTMALDEVQQQQKATLLENEQLRDQLAHMHAASGAMDQQFQQLQHVLAKEVNDKRLVMEERDAALQSQDNDDLARRIIELEGLYRLEQQRVQQLEQQRQWIDSSASSTSSLSSTTRRHSKPVPFSMHHCSGVIMPDQPKSSTKTQLYCEICEIHGHDVMGCKALLMGSTIIDDWYN